VSDKMILCDNLARLCAVMNRLRAPGGCPWDAEQTPTSLKPYIIEEAYELVDALDSGDQRAICEELGDLLLQVVFQAEIHDEMQQFDLRDVISGITDKLIRRHPHVFARQDDRHSTDHELRWDQIKAEEKTASGVERDLLSDIPNQLPALQKTQKIFSKLIRHGQIPSLPGIVHSSVLNTDNPELLETRASIVRDLYHAVMTAEENGIDAESLLREFNGNLIARHRS